MVDIATTLTAIKQGSAEVLVETALVERLKTGNPLRIKFGMDPTAPDLHLGHTLVLMKMQQLQALGHHIVLLIGDFTALIGDPTGKNITRQPLAKEQIDHNAQTYTQQVFKLLDPQKTEVLFNSQWLGEKGADFVLQLAARTTVARMLERDDFNKRFKLGTAIAIHEFLYPLLQGWDSVELKADVELGGTDQKFNLLMGRELQKNMGQQPQTIVTMPLLEGTDGVRKMSKSLGNYIGITESAEQMFGKIMSLSDALMWRYYDLLSSQSPQQITRFKAEIAAGANPRDYKIALAKEIICYYHNTTAAKQAHKDFMARFQQGAMPDDVPEMTLRINDKQIPIANLLKQAQLVRSTSEALRMLKSGAVKIDGVKITDKHLQIAPGTENIYQVGKRRFAKVKILLIVEKVEV